MVPKTNKNQWVCNEIISSIHDGFLPETFVLDTKESEKVSVYLNQNALFHLNLIKVDMPISQKVANLIVAKAKSQARSKPTETEQDHVFANLRKEQVELINQVEPLLDQCHIVFQEAGTGIGKTRAALVIASRYFEKHSQPIVYTVPTVALISQALSDFEKLDAQSMGIQEKPSIAPMIAKSSFVDPEKLKAYLLSDTDANEEDALKINQWIEAGAGYVESSNTKLVHEHLPGMCYLKDDLLALCPNYHVDYVLLNELDEIEKCPAREAYLTMREMVKSANIIVCTHAMVALDAIKQGMSIQELTNYSEHLAKIIDDKMALGLKLDADNLKKTKAKVDAKINRLNQLDLDDTELTSSILPKYKMLIVDEAHQFESSIASIKTSDAIFRFIINHLDHNLHHIKKCKAKGEYDHLRQLLIDVEKKLIEFGGKNKNDHSIVISNHPEHKFFRKQLRDSIADDFESILRASTQLIKKCSSVKNLLSSLMVVATNMNGNSDTVTVNFSPKRKLPSIHTGPKSIKNVVERIWNQVDAALLMSATLAITDKLTGMPKIGFIRTQLHVSVDRSIATKPITQPWLYDAKLNVMDYKRSEFIPPEYDENNDQPVKLWAKSIADELIGIHQKAKGAVLVLTSSFDKIEEIEKALFEKEASFSIIAQKRNRSVRAYQKIFIEQAKQGMKPLWLGAGSAWTGIDIKDDRISDEHADQDYLFTDLVICNIPFGTNRSSTHLARQDWLKTAERDRAVLEFKQGIGRLKRRNHLKERKIHILDPRIFDPSRNTGFYSPFRAVLEAYKK